MATFLTMPGIRKEDAALDRTGYVSRSEQRLSAWRHRLEEMEYVRERMPPERLQEHQAYHDRIKREIEQAAATLTMLHDSNERGWERAKMRMEHDWETLEDAWAEWLSIAPARTQHA